MKFSVHIATMADCPAFAALSVAAFKDDPMVGYLTRDVPPEILHTYQCQRYERLLETSALNGLKVFKAVDDDTGWVVFTVHVGIRIRCLAWCLEVPSGFGKQIHRVYVTDEQ